MNLRLESRSWEEKTDNINLLIEKRLKRSRSPAKRTGSSDDRRVEKWRLPGWKCRGKDGVLSLDRQSLWQQNAEHISQNNHTMFDKLQSIKMVGCCCCANAFPIFPCWLMYRKSCVYHALSALRQCCILHAISPCTVISTPCYLHGQELYVCSIKCVLYKSTIINEKCVHKVNGRDKEGKEKMWRLTNSWQIAAWTALGSLGFILRESTVTQMHFTHTHFTGGNSSCSRACFWTCTM